MKQTVSKSQFRDAFHNCGRGDQFSYDALGLIFDYLEEEEIELDPIAICCEFSEESFEEIADNYSIDLSMCDDDDDKLQEVRDHLEYNTQVAGELNDGSLVYIQF